MWDLLGGAVDATAGALTAPVRAHASLMAAGAGFLWRQAMRAPPVADGVAAANRLWSWLQSRADCVEDTRQPPSGGGSGHLVADGRRHQQRHGPRHRAARSTSTPRARLPRRRGRRRSRTRRTAARTRRRTPGAGSRRSAEALRDQLRALQREQPGREVDLVAHSQGGVVVAEFLLHDYDAGDPTLPPLGTVVTLVVAAPGRTGGDGRGAGARVRQRARRARRGRQARPAARSRPTAADSTAPAGRGLAAHAPARHAIRCPSRSTSPRSAAPTTSSCRRTTRRAPGARSVTVEPAGSTDHSGILARPGRARRGPARARRARPLPCVGFAAGVRGAVEPVVISRAEHTGARWPARSGTRWTAASGRGGAP